jgi:hypothetical protein
MSDESKHLLNQNRNPLARSVWRSRELEDVD